MKLRIGTYVLHSALATLFLYRMGVSVQNITVLLTLSCSKLNVNSPLNHSENFDHPISFSFTLISHNFLKLRWLFRTLLQVSFGTTAFEKVLPVLHHPDFDPTLFAAQVNKFWDGDNIAKAITKQRFDKIWFPFPSYTFLVRISLSFFNHTIQRPILCTS